MKPRFPREIVTRELDDEDIETLAWHTRIVDEDGNTRPMTESELRESTTRIVAARNIMTGEMETKVHSKTHDGKELPFFVVKAGK